MHRFRLPSRIAISALFAAAVLLRIAIPAGYMPTSADNGWYLKFCPDGMAADVMVALLGDDHQHHHHAGHHTTNQATSTVAAEPVFAQCDLGGGLALEALTNAVTIDALALSPTTTRLATNVWQTSSEQWRRFRSRAPPALV